MVCIRALHKRLARLERADVPQRSPLVVMYGSFDEFVEVAIRSGVLDGSLDCQDMIDILTALRKWEGDGTWDRARH